MTFQKYLILILSCVVMLASSHQERHFGGAQNSGSLRRQNSQGRGKRGLQIDTTESPTASLVLGVPCEDNMVDRGFVIDGKDKGCKWLINQSKEKRVSVCKNAEGVAEFCPLSCKTCSATTKPTSFDQCRDNLVDNGFVVDGKEVGCQWLRDQDKQARNFICNKNDNAAEFCPVTCEACEQFFPTSSPVPTAFSNL